MSDKEKLLQMLEYSNGCFEDILCNYLTMYDADFSAIRLFDLLRRLEYQFLEPKIRKLELMRSVANERATYLRQYLKGDMYTTREAAEQNLPRQIENAEYIIDICNR